MDQMSSVEQVEPQDSPHDRSGWHHPVGSVMIRHDPSMPCRGYTLVGGFSPRKMMEWVRVSWDDIPNIFGKYWKVIKVYIKVHGSIMFQTTKQCWFCWFCGSFMSATANDGLFLERTARSESHEVFSWDDAAFTTCRASVSDPLTALTSPPASSASASKQNDAISQ